MESVAQYSHPLIIAISVILIIVLFAGLSSIKDEEAIAEGDATETETSDSVFNFDFKSTKTWLVVGLVLAFVTLALSAIGYFA